MHFKYVAFCDKKKFITKLNELINWSDYETVQKKADELDLGTVYPSNLKSKKYMMYNPMTLKYSHFGLMGSEDWTKHRDLDRKKNFKNRNKKWADAEMYSPAYLSYYLLW
jgi:hypothetical protein